MDDPELKDEILLPLKMQGVADIDDNALVVRFKFTVKPSKPSFVQREALKRTFRAFPAAGIEFANAMGSANSLAKAVPWTPRGPVRPARDPQQGRQRAVI